MSSRVRVSPGQPLLEIDGTPQYVHGANYGWRNYSEFGSAIFGDANRVVNHSAAIEADFEQFASQGVTAVRWFLFGNGNSGIEFDLATQFPTGLTPGVFDDMDQAIGIARRHGIRILFSVLDYLMQADGGHPEMLKSLSGQRAFMDHVMQPVLDRYGSEDGIFAWEVMNEPDLVISDLNRWKARVKRPLKFHEFARFVRMFSAAVHRSTDALVTVGGAKARNAARWDGDDLGLDFVQVHHYCQDGDKTRDLDLFDTPAVSLQLTRPLLIGEVPGKNDGHVPPVGLADWLTFGFEQGYAGIWPWAFTSGDEYSPYDGDAMRQFARQHPAVSNPAALDSSPP